MRCAPGGHKKAHKWLGDATSCSQKQFKPNSHPELQQRQNAGQLSLFAHRHAPLLQRSSLSLSQRFPQLPQLSKSVAKSLQALLQHVEPLAHTLPQLPQLASSLRVSTHAPSQHVWFEPQFASLVQTQRPALHVRLLGQVTLHDPQF